MRPKTVIRSAANPAVKRVRAVQAGREPGRVVLEGDRLVEEALAGGWSLELVLVADTRASLADELEARGLPVERVEAGLLARASELSTSPGLLAVAAAPVARPLAELAPAGDDLLVVAAGVADPGNLGALSRSAEAAGARALVVLAGGARPWNGKALRGSMGSLLRLPVHLAEDAGELAQGLAAQGWRQVRAATRGGTPLARFDWSGPVALWIGAETGRLPDAARDLERVTIPMAGRAESLNVAAAAAVLLYAAGRAERAP